MADSTKRRGAGRQVRRTVRLSQVRRPVMHADPAKAEAQARIRAAKLCSTSLWCGIAAAICVVLIGAIGVFLAGGVGLVAGLWGLIQLSALGPGNPNEPDVSPIERVSARMYKRGQTQGITGLLISIAAIIVSVLLMFASAGR